MMFKLKLGILLIYSVLILSCGKTYETSESFDKGFIDYTRIWKKPSQIPVCFANFKKVAAFQKVKREIRKVVTDQFSRTKNVRFSGWDSCEGQNETIRIALDANYGGGLSFVGNPKKFRLRNYREATMLIGVKGPIRDIKFLALHEFGHAIGLLHEHQRVDSACDPAVWDQIYVPETLVKVYRGEYDSRSVMDYCSGRNPRLSRGDIEAIDFLFP